MGCASSAKETASNIIPQKTKDIKSDPRAAPQVAPQQRGPMTRDIPHPEDKMIHEMPADVALAYQMYTSQVVVHATIKSFESGMATMSMPPQCQYILTLDDITVLRGDLPSQPLKIKIIGDDKPVTGTPLALFGDYEEEYFMFNGMIVKSLDDIKAELKSNPYGWVNCQSPFGYDFPVSCDKAGALVCPSTSFPSFNLEGFSVHVEKVIPSDVNPDVNPFGNGKFLIKVCNDKQDAQVCKNLFKDKNGNILFEESIIAIIGDKPYVWSTKLPSDASQVQFGVGQTVSGEIDTLKLKEVEWPQGGSRVYFKFALGDKMDHDFFYYNSSVHDSMRK
ncbi:hypothetical protein SS50377_22078 [Spironucleus salmonicida]|uniref:Uncharacterized protein n=1 Tax=Spironucleus salmonicida TaxID=348837 RepID=V6LMA0_9EUKA|nr:hypothetical protein SS50377_22078 [Spironucleus salmonicida]|eukprot:EST45760.1 hypothetical protein SS50377_14331 [Spironucleus salmonicida]